MRVVLYTISISPHQLPLAIEIQKIVGQKNFRYVFRVRNNSEREKLGWDVNNIPEWVIYHEDVEASQWLESADILLSGERDVKLFKRRVNKGLKNFYAAERWFKPPWGMFRLLHPRFFLIAWRMAELIKSGGIVYLPMGIHAAKDMMRLCGLLSGDWCCLFRSPRLDFERKPMGKIWSEQGHRENSYTEQMRMWGYFVKASKSQKDVYLRKYGQIPLKIFWAGRMLALKKVDTLIRAVIQLLDEGFSFHLQIVGVGSEDTHLKRLASRYIREDAQSNGITFSTQVPINDVRCLMQQADIYVLASNAYEGWGAVLNEAMNEGCSVVGTYEAGSSATMIENDINGLLFHSGDIQTLVGHLRSLHDNVFRQRLGEAGQQTAQCVWSAQNAAKQMFVPICQILE